MNQEWPCPFVSEWTSEQLDLESYLARVGCSSVSGANERTLADLHRAHVNTVPFENIDIVLGRPIRLGLAEAQRKLITHGRGGYCYEHALVFAAALEQLGFGVHRLLARVAAPQQPPRPATHMMLLVHDGSRTYVADVGFGSGPLAPIPLENGLEAQQGAWSYRLVRIGTWWELQEQRRGDWSVLYRFRDDPVFFADVVMANHYASTWPRSPFARGMVVVRRDLRCTTRLIGRRLSEERPNGQSTVVGVSDRDLPSTLRRLGVALTVEESSRVTWTTGMMANLQQ